MYQVSPETREKIIAMRRSRQQELAAAKKDEEEPRIAQNVQTGEVSHWWCLRRVGKRDAIIFIFHIL